MKSKLCCTADIRLIAFLSTTVAQLLSLPHEVITPQICGTYSRSGHSCTVYTTTSQERFHVNGSKAKSGGTTSIYI